MANAARASRERLIGCCRMTMRYEAIRQDDPVLRERLKELARVLAGWAIGGCMSSCAVRAMR